MGTSTNYNAPPSWKNLKAEVTRAANRGPLNSAGAAELVRSFIRHNGGGAGMGRGGGGGTSVGNGAAARSVAQRVGGFLSDVGALGFAEALRREGLGDLAGRPVLELLAALLDRLGGSASTIDDVDARAALARLQDECFAQAETVDELEGLLNAEIAHLDGFLERYFGCYLYELFCRVFYEQLSRLIGDARATSFLSEIREFVTQSLTHRLGGRDIASIDWAGDEGARLSSDIMESTMNVFSVQS